MNRVFKRSFCTAKSQLSRHGYFAFSKNTVVFGMLLGGGAGGGLAATVLLQSFQLNDMTLQVSAKKAELKGLKEEHQKLQNKAVREKSEFEAVVVKKEEVISTKEEELTSANNAIETKVQALNAQSFILTQTKDKLNATSQEHSKLQRRHKDLKSIKTKLTGDLTNCVKTRETTVERLTREKSELRSQLSTLNRQNNNLEKVIGNLRAEVKLMTLAN